MAAGWWILHVVPDLTAEVHIGWPRSRGARMMTSRRIMWAMVAAAILVAVGVVSIGDGVLHV